MQFPKIEIVKDGKDQVLVIRAVIPAVKDLEVSGSGKSLMIASTNGNVKVGVKINGEDLVVGLNAYTKNPSFKAPEPSKKK